MVTKCERLMNARYTDGPQGHSIPPSVNHSEAAEEAWRIARPNPHAPHPPIGSAVASPIAMMRAPAIGTYSRTHAAARAPALGWLGA